ncbi:MAG TPA: hypothetical protein VHD33_05165 [Legionellaceae bacterium]|nr:hypothetical protein [Legionellaceae bacterium]
MSQATMQQEILLALECRTVMFKALSKHQHIHPLIQKELINILYAKNITQLEIAQKNIEFLLHQQLSSTDPKYQMINHAFNDLLEHRKVYLKPPQKTYRNFWSDEGWTGLSFAILTVPFIVGLFVPVVGSIALGYATLDAVLSSIDMGRAHRSYWSEEDPPETRILSEEQIRTLQQSHIDIEDFLPENNPDPNQSMTQRIDQASYWTYALVFTISLVGLAALLFPPIGIPTIALFCLSAVAIAGTGLQLGLIYEKQQMDLHAIQDTITQSKQLRSTPHPHHQDINTLLSAHTPSHATHLTSQSHSKQPQTTPGASSLLEIPQPKKISQEKEEDEENKTNDGFHF